MVVPVSTAKVRAEFVAHRLPSAVFVGTGDDLLRPGVRCSGIPAGAFRSPEIRSAFRTFNHSALLARPGTGQNSFC